MADPDPKQNPTRETDLEISEIARDLVGIACPHVQDSRRNNDPLGRLQQRLERR
jgi:hypothetical protein